MDDLSQLTTLNMEAKLCMNRALRIVFLVDSKMQPPPPQVSKIAAVYNIVCCRLLETVRSPSIATAVYSRSRRTQETGEPTAAVLAVASAAKRFVRWCRRLL